MDLDEPLKKKVESFRNAVSVFLASLLWQGCRSEAGIQKRINKLKLSVNPADRYSSWNFMARVLASIGGAGVAAYVLLYLADWQFSSYFGHDFWHLTLAVLILSMIALFVTRRTEARLTAGKSESALDASLGSAFFYGLPIGFVAALTTFAVHQGGQAAFWAMLWTGLSLAVFAAFLFEFVMRWAAQSAPAPGGGARNVWFYASGPAATA